VLREILYWFSPPLAMRLDVFCIIFYIDYNMRSKPRLSLPTSDATLSGCNSYKHTWYESDGT